MSAEAYGHFRDASDVIAFCNTSFAASLGCTEITSANLLSGGLANFVYRITDSTAKTFIFKYYPPFVAKSETMEFSQSRYFVEKEALQLVSEKISHSVVKVPRVMAVDDALHVLVLEDAGKGIISLMDYFAVGKEANEEYISHGEIAEHLSSFLLSLSKLSPTSSTFAHPTAWAILNMAYQGTFKSRAAASGVPELESWAARVKPLAPPAEAGNRVLIMGDFWPNSVYLDVTQPQKELWMLDWEMCRMGDAVSDVRQMCCNLWLMESAPQRFREADVREFRKEMLQRRGHNFPGTAMGPDDQVAFVCLASAIMSNEFWRAEDSEGALRKLLKGAETYLEG